MLAGIARQPLSLCDIYHKLFQWYKVVLSGKNQRMKGLFQANRKKWSGWRRESSKQCNYFLDNFIILNYSKVSKVICGYSFYLAYIL